MKMTPATPASAAGCVNLPWDLSQWVPKSLLMDWIFQEIEQLNWGNPLLVEQLKSNPGYRPKLMLAMVTWAYATGYFESGEIVTACQSDERWRERSGGAVAEERPIRRFRKENRGLLKWSLLQLFKRAVRTQFHLGQSRLPVGLIRYLDETAAMRIDIARQMDRGSSGF